MTEQEILATPAPWKMHDMERNTIVANHISVADFNAKSRPDAENSANALLTIRLRNAYEADRATITALANALTHQIYRNHGYSEVCDACRHAPAALALTNGGQ